MRHLAARYTERPDFRPTSNHRWKRRVFQALRASLELVQWYNPRYAIGEEESHEQRPPNNHSALRRRVREEIPRSSRRTPAPYCASCTAYSPRGLFSRGSRWRHCTRGLSPGIWTVWVPPWLGLRTARRPLWWRTYLRFIRRCTLAARRLIAPTTSPNPMARRKGSTKISNSWWIRAIFARKFQYS